MFVHIKNIAVLYNGRAYKQNELLNQGKYPVLRVGNLFTNNSWYYSNLELESEKYCDKGDLLYSWSASFGPHIWTGDRVIYHYHIWKIDFSKYVYKKYLYYFLLADTDRIKRSGHGLAMIHVTKASTEERLFPLPPLAEQKRIVARIEELLPLIDRYEKAWNRLEDFNQRFPADMQKSLLQLAIQGKLVEQRPEEGTGEELYRQIQKEKQAFIKAGRIKKGKPLPKITEDEIPFDIPEDWKWVRLGEIILSVADGPHFSPQYYESGVPFLSTRNVASGKIDFSTAKYISRELHEELCLRCKPKKWDILYTKGGTTGIAVVNDTDIEFNVWVHVAVLSMGSYVYPYYLAMALNSPHCFELSQLYTHGTSNRDLGLTRMVKITLPLPPLAEQKRIVAKLEELLPLCERLK